MIKSDDKSIGWVVDLPLEKADEQYVHQYFQNRTVMSRERKRSIDRYPRMISDAAAAMVAYVQDEALQTRLFDLYDNLEREYVQEYRSRHNLGARDMIPDMAMREIDTRISDTIIAECHVWFSKFWSITQQVTLTFDMIEEITV
jgi:hypothetical protein